MSTVWSIIGAIIAIVVALWLVNVAFSIAWFIVKALIVVAVAAVVYAFIKQAFKSRDRQR